MQGQAAYLQMSGDAPDARSIAARRTLADAALRAAAKHYTHAEYLELERDVQAGRVEVRVYDEGLVLMRVAA